MYLAALIWQSTIVDTYPPANKRELKASKGEGV